jgi:hypothetical protein
MTALANSLKRVWSAKNRVPHLTGWGTSGSWTASKAETVVCWTYERAVDLIAVFRRTAPTFIVVACSFFR